jgi:hypothetical protein
MEAPALLPRLRRDRGSRHRTRSARRATARRPVRQLAARKDRSEGPRRCRISEPPVRERRADALTGKNPIQPHAERERHHHRRRCVRPPCAGPVCGEHQLVQRRTDRCMARRMASVRVAGPARRTRAGELAVGSTHRGRPECAGNNALAERHVRFFRRSLSSHERSHRHSRRTPRTYPARELHRRAEPCGHGS